MNSMKEEMQRDTNSVIGKEPERVLEAENCKAE